MSSHKIIVSQLNNIHSIRSFERISLDLKIFFKSPFFIKGERRTHSDQTQCQETIRTHITLVVSV